MEFKNKPNTCITMGGKEYWISRSVAIVGMIGFKLLSDGKVYFPIQIRGSKMTNRGCACIPCGYIDYNETIEKCLIREFWEETGIDITQYKVIFGSLDKADHYVSDPNDSDVQNISFTFEAILECEKLPELIVSEESVSLNWMTFNELQYINAWAFNHKNKITKFIDKYAQYLIDHQPDKNIKCKAKSLEPVNIPDGKYMALWSAYYITVLMPDWSEISVKMNNGVRGINCKETVLIKNGIVYVI